ncbi:retron system putative HNH endonuclease [Aeromonas media]|uniref:retron system putative HNH endonuclease n=1 Tax=Aeromonas caviae TaxID=648 RepID=UPI00254090B8|nr:retron system putative HNH endonuclease [Aeromonas caviae]MDK3166590.1 TIGR02646 family protein [Aeromonas caviae]
MKVVTQSTLYVHALSIANQTPPQTKEQATSRWSSFGHKDELQSRLLKQQYHLCCYSEVRADLLGLDYHIEHVENKSQVPKRTFDESNLAASVLSSDRVTMLEKADVFGGHAVGKQAGVDMARFVHCHQADCARYFAYLSDGRVVPSVHLNEPERDRAQYSIDLLNLNSAYLVNLRQHLWNELEQLEEQHLANGWDINQLLRFDLVPNAHQQLSPFFSLTRQFFGQIAEAVLRREAPEIA